MCTNTQTITVKQAANILNKDSRTIYRYCEQGILDYIKTGKKGRRITTTSLEKFLESIGQPTNLNQLEATPTPAPTTAYSINQVANMLGVSGKTITTLVNNGELAATRVGKQRRITQAAINSYLLKNSNVNYFPCKLSQHDLVGQAAE